MARVVVEPDLAVRVENDIPELLILVANEIVNDAQRFAPVLSGRLRSGIHAEAPIGNTVRIRSDAPYAAYVELGTRNMAAQPYLRPAVFKKRG